MLAFLLAAATAHAAIDPQQLSSYRWEIIKRGAHTNDKQERDGGLAENFVEGPLTTSLTVLEQRGFNTGRSSVEPWSGHYWANMNGGLAWRWADPNFPRDFVGGINYARSHRWDQTPWNYLSPAEKYDYLTGVNPFETNSLTNQQWNLGLDEYNRTGQVTSWAGICHGWSPASIYLPEPKRDVIFKFPAGDLYFTVDDIKAIGSLYWANGRYESVYAGFRCDDANPPTNADGRVLDPKCFDTNPGDWHLILTNMVGMKAQPFIMDASETNEIWNHPVVSYKVRYFDATNFNVQSPTFAQVLRRVDRTPNLRHGQFRSPRAVYVVGAVSTVTIAVENLPGDRRTLRKEVNFTYDLELDENMNIIGGEWRNTAHPDFLWRRKGQQVPMPVGQDVQLDMWRMGDATWRQNSLLNSAKGVPMKFFVEQLYRMSTAQQ